MFSDRVRSGDFMTAAGASDTLSARIIEEAGFDAIWLGSLVGTASLLGTADIGLMTPFERVEQVRRMRHVTSLPIVVDFEVGWGGALHVAYWTKQFETAGADAIMLEDKQGDFNTPYVQGSLSEVEPLEEAVNKLRAALDARVSSNFLIIARSAARRKYGMQEQLKRLAAYKDAGSDMIWASSSHPDTLAEYRKNLEGPLWATCNINAGEQAKLTLSDFKRLGIQVVGYETVVYLASLKATIQAAKKVKDTGTITALKGDMLEFEEFLRLAGFGEMATDAKKYGVVR